MNLGHANKGLSNKTSDQLVTTPIPAMSICIYQILQHYFSKLERLLFVIYRNDYVSSNKTNEAYSPSVEIQPEGGSPVSRVLRPGVSEAL